MNQSEEKEEDDLLPLDDRLHVDRQVARADRTHLLPRESPVPHAIALNQERDPRRQLALTAIMTGNDRSNEHQHTPLTKTLCVKFHLFLFSTLTLQFALLLCAWWVCVVVVFVVCVCVVGLWVVWVDLIKVAKWFFSYA